MENDEPFNNSMERTNSRASDLKSLPKIETNTQNFKVFSDKTLDFNNSKNNLDIPSGHHQYTDNSPAFISKSPSTVTGLVPTNKIAPVTPITAVEHPHSSRPQTGSKDIYNLPSKFETLQQAESVVEVFNLSKGREYSQFVE